MDTSIVKSSRLLLHPVQHEETQVTRPFNRCRIQCLFSHLTVASLHIHQQPHCPGDRLERVLVGWDLANEVAANERYLGQDILADLWNLTEEEQSEDTGDTSEASSDHAADRLLVPGFSCS